MKVSRIVYHNILGLEDLDIRPGKVTVISGDNGLGKSSCIDPLVNLMEGGHDKWLSRTGTEDAELLFEIEHEEHGKVTFRKNMMTGELEARDANNKKLTKAKALFESIFDRNSFNPACFLLATDKEKTRMILDHLPRKVMPQDLLDVGIGAEDGINPAVLDNHALPALAAVRDTIYKTRHGINQLARQAKAAIADLERALPEEQPGITGALKEKRTALEGMESDRLRKHAAVKELLGKETSGAEWGSREAISAKQATYLEEKTAIERQITELQGQLALKEQDFRTFARTCEAERDKQVAEARTEANRAYGEYTVGQEASRNTLTAEIATLEAAHTQQIRLEQSREMIEQRRVEALENEAAADRLTRILARVDALEGKLLGDLPIPGLSYKDGELMKGDLPIRRLNTAQQVGLSFTIARLGGSPFIVADKLECLSTKTFAAFEEAALKLPKVQFLVTRVSDEEFNITRKD